MPDQDELSEFEKGKLSAEFNKYSDLCKAGFAIGAGLVGFAIRGIISGDSLYSSIQPLLSGLSIMYVCGSGLRMESKAAVPVGIKPSAAPPKP